MDQDYQYKWRDALPIIPCMVCGKPGTHGYCSETCERIDLGKVCVVSIREVLEGEP